MQGAPGRLNDQEVSTSLSKRAARRLIQRAIVLLGRDKIFRQRIRNVQLNTCWSVEDWDLEWTVALSQGHPEFYRGHTGPVQSRLKWEFGEEFLAQVETGKHPGHGFELECDPAARTIVGVLLSRFCATLKSVLADPVDDDGVRLV